MSSILNDVKQMLGVEADYDAFDTDIIININSVFMVLNQLGVGPKECFSIKDELATWESFTQGKIDIEATKTYVYLRTRLLFDPPANSFTISALDNQAKELGWRLLAQTEARSETEEPTENIEPMTKEDIDKMFDIVFNETED